MTRVVALLLLMCLLVPSSVLAGQGTIVERSPDYWYSYSEKLPIGSSIRVRTSDRHRLTAVLTHVDRDGITIELKTRIPEPARHIPFDQIQQLELKTNGSSMAKAAAVGAAIGAGTFLGLMMLAVANWD
jgi:hypothetical protein